MHTRKMPYTLQVKRTWALHTIQAISRILLGFECATLLQSQPVILKTSSYFKCFFGAYVSAHWLTPTT